MTVYILNLLLIIVGAVFLLDMFRDKWSKRIYFVLVVIALALVAGLRHVTIGIDTPNYYDIFKRASVMSLDTILKDQTGEVERGFMVFQHFVAMISTNFNVLLIIISFIFVSSVAILIYRNSSESCLSFIFFIGLGFYTFSMTGLRQSLALAIILFSFNFIKQRRLIPFLIFVILASTIHLSALVFIPAYFLGYKRITKSYVVIATVLIPLSFILKGPIFSFLSKLSGYGYNPFANEGPYLLVGLMIIVLLAGFIQREDVLARDTDNIIFYNMSIISIMLGMLTFVNPSALRAAYYYHIYLILFIPEIVMSVRDKRLRNILYAIGLVGIVFLEIRELNSNPSLVPYMFFWQ